MSDPVKDEQKEDVSEGAMDDSIHAERVEDEKDENKKYLKTNRPLTLLSPSSIQICMSLPLYSEIFLNGPIKFFE